jgi:MYXO-CTERM domain-containing protein
LTELNLLNSNSITVGGSRPLGEAYVAGAVRRQDEDLAFQYSTPDGKVWDGIVEYLGAVNDLVLRVDPTTGAAAIQNFSPHVDFDIKGYDITSASGSLSVADWTSFQDTGNAGPNWFEANPSANNLSELNLLSSTSFTTGVQVLLGDILANVDSRDLVFKFATTDGEVLEGTVEYGESEQGGQPGDTDNDGDVDLDDLNAVRNNFGTSGAPGIPGDAFPFDGTVDLDDLNGVRNNFGAGASQAVPEPSAAMLGLIALAVVGGWQRRRVLSSRR